MTAPEIMYDLDGCPCAVLRSTAATPRRALTIVIEEDDWYDEFFRVTDDDRCVPILSEFRVWLADIEPTWWRPRKEDEDGIDPWHEEAWFECDEDHTGAVAYWRIPP